jgi:hypothetical protein
MPIGAAGNAGSAIADRKVIDVLSDSDTGHANDDAANPAPVSPLAEPDNQAILDANKRILEADVANQDSNDAGADSLHHNEADRRGLRASSPDAGILPKSKDAASVQALAMEEADAVIFQRQVRSKNKTTQLFKCMRQRLLATLSSYTLQYWLM